jgi:nucleotide-binding universal stress UspA family protein
VDTHIGGRIVVGIDGSDGSLGAARWAAVEAHRRDLPLRLVAAVAWAGYVPIALPGAGEEYQRDILLKAARSAVDLAAAAATEEAPGVAVDVVVRGGVPAHVLVEESARASLLVVGNRGNGGFAGLLLGSVGISVAARATCPVVVVRGTTDHRDRPDGPVVVGVDGSLDAEPALVFAFEEASRRGVPLLAVHAWVAEVMDPDVAPYIDWDAVAVEEERVLTDTLAPWEAEFPGVEVRRSVVRDGAARALVTAAECADLVVVGTHGYGWMRGLLLGSVGQSLLQHAPCPVAVVRPAREEDEEPADRP